MCCDFPPLQRYFLECSKMFDTRAEHIELNEKDVGKLMVVYQKRGALLKLGGSKKSRWEDRVFELDDKGLAWFEVSDVKDTKMKGYITIGDMVNCAAGTEDAPYSEVAMTLHTSCKGGKDYVLKSASQEDRDDWIKKINSLIKMHHL